MLAAERRYQILERVAEQQAIHVNELAEEFGVSEMTVRRDIRRMERDGFLRQTYGGAIAHVTRSLELAFNARALQHATAKRLIGIEAARLIGDVATMFLGIGTTVEQFALFLPRRDDLTVVTASLPVASLLGTRRGRVVALGGTVRNEELSCYGSAPVVAAARYHADLAVLGAAGVSLRDGISELYEDDAELHRVMIEHSDTLMVLVDASKLGSVERSLVVPLSQVDILVTDDSAPEAILEAVRAIIPRVVTVHRRSDAQATAPPHVG
jgi:DeoR/GlpR family transcriptional regulator of sugar metabolism